MAKYVYGPHAGALANLPPADQLMTLAAGGTGRGRHHERGSAADAAVGIDRPDTQAHRPRSPRPQAGPITNVISEPNQRFGSELMERPPAARPLARSTGKARI